jgi:hypothetical protein
MKNLEAIVLYADSARGIYIPQYFAESSSKGWSGVEESERDILLEGPEHLEYWDAWCKVLDNAEYHNHGHVWRLYQNGDLFVVCDELMTDDEYEGFYGELRA